MCSHGPRLCGWIDIAVIIFLQMVLAFATNIVTSHSLKWPEQTVACIYFIYTGREPGEHTDLRCQLCTKLNCVCKGGRQGFADDNSVFFEHDLDGMSTRDTFEAVVKIFS